MIRRAKHSHPVPQYAQAIVHLAANNEVFYKFCVLLKLLKSVPPKFLLDGAIESEQTLFDGQWHYLIVLIPSKQLRKDQYNFPGQCSHCKLDLTNKFVRVRGLTR